MCRVIDLVKTGKNIERLLAERGLTAKDVQQRLGFAERRPVYFWIAGKNLPSIDNLFILTEMLQVPIDEILIAKVNTYSREVKIHMSEIVHQPGNWIF